MKRIVFILLATCLVYCNKDKDEPASEEEKVVNLSRPTVLFGSKSQVYALDADSGKLIWKQNATLDGSMGHYTTPTYSNGVMYLVQGSIMNKYMTAYDATTGTSKWNTFIEHGNNPTVKYGSVYVTNDWGDTYSIDKKTGTVNWVDKSSRRSVVDAITCSPTVKDSILYSGNRYSILFAVNALTGKSIWSFGFSNVERLTYRPIVNNGVVYFRTNGALIAANAADGKTIWRTDFLASVYYPSSPVLVNGALYAVTPGLLCSFDASTGIKNWEFKPAEVGAIYTSPIVWNNLAFIANAGGNRPSFIYAVDIATGQQVWKHQDSQEFFCSPAIYNGNLYIGNAQGLQVIDAASGQLKWKFTPDNDEPVVTGVCIVDTNNKLYTVSSSGDYE